MARRVARHSRAYRSPQGCSAAQARRRDTGESYTIERSLSMGNLYRLEISWLCGSQQRFPAIPGSLARLLVACRQPPGSRRPVWQDGGARSGRRLGLYIAIQTIIRQEDETYISQLMAWRRNQRSSAAIFATFQRQQRSMSGDIGCFQRKQTLYATIGGIFQRQQRPMPGDIGCFQRRQTVYATIRGIFQRP